MGVACGEPFDADALYAEVRSAEPYAALAREDFDRVVDFVSTGGYALKTYDRFRRIVKGPDGLWRVRNGEIAQRHRMNVGAIVEIPMLAIRIAVSPRRQARAAGARSARWRRATSSSWRPATPSCSPARSGGSRRSSASTAWSRPRRGADPRVPSWGGSKFALSTYLAKRVRRMIADRPGWVKLPDEVREWLEIQARRSVIPAEDEMLVESFQRGRRHFLVCYPFDGRISHGTLAQLLTRRLERAGAGPLGFVANDYALAVWCLRPLDDLDLGELFQEDMLGDDLEAWLDESFMMKRAFRHCAMLSGLIERRHPGQEKTGRQVTFSTDLIYDVLRRHQPDHLLLRCARADAAAGSLDVARLGLLLQRIKGRIHPVALTKVSPFAVPALLEIGREPVAGAAQEALLERTPPS